MLLILLNIYLSSAYQGIDYVSIQYIRNLSGYCKTFVFQELFAFYVLILNIQLMVSQAKTKLINKIQQKHDLLKNMSGSLSKITSSLTAEKKKSFPLENAKGNDHHKISP